MKDDIDFDVEYESPEEKDDRLDDVLSKATFSSDELPVLDDRALSLKNCKMYPMNLGWYEKCKSAIALQLFLWAVEHLESDGTVIMNGPRKRRFMKACGVTEQSVYNALKELSRLCILLKVAEDVPGPHSEYTGEIVYMEGEYWMNPIVAWRGSERSRRDQYVRMKHFYPRMTTYCSDEMMLKNR